MNKYKSFSIPYKSDSGVKIDGRDMLLLRLRFKEGRLLEVGNNRPILLTDPQSIWIVYTGSVDIFAVQVEHGEAVGSRLHIFRAETGCVLFGITPDESMYGLLISPTLETQLLRVSQSRFWEIANNPEFGPTILSMIEDWIVALSSIFPAGLPPKDLRLLEGNLTLSADQGARPKTRVDWVKPISGTLQFADRADLPSLPNNCYMPIARNIWVQARDDVSLETVDAATLIEADADQWSGYLTVFNVQIMQAIAVNARLTDHNERERLVKRIEHDQAQVTDALYQVAALLEPPIEARKPLLSAEEALFDAASRVGQALNIEIQPAPPENTANNDPLASLARASRLQLRKVMLHGKWWQKDGGPLLAYLTDQATSELRPVALLPTSPQTYHLYDPASRTEVAVNVHVAGRLSPQAYSFYRPFAAGEITLGRLIRYALFGSRRDVLRLLVMGIGGGLVSTFIPIATGAIFSYAIPASARSELFLIVAALAASALSSAVFQIIRNVAFLRLAGHADLDMQAALWDRLLVLPANFFRKYSAGDLSARAMGISNIYRMLSGSVIGSVLSGIFSIFSLFLLFTYSLNLAVVALLLVALATSITIFFGWLQVRQQRKLIEMQGIISGLVLQFINGMAKFRVAGAENRAFSFWMRQFAAQKEVAFKARSIQNDLMVFNAIFPIMTTIVVFGMIGFSRQLLSTGDFVAFNAAFAQFLAAGMQLSGAVIIILTAVPLYERAKPILETAPEVSVGKTSPGQLSGAIEVNHVNFRYKQDDPLILTDISLQAAPGEFIALVGTSGSGKSTLLRLLLGFEQPESGSLYFDGRDLNGLDLQAVRRQIGVVMQNGKLMAGDIFQNIVGSSLSTIDDAWEAARMAGLEADIKAMPMGMFTVVSEGGGTLSGGQRQRLLIARAIVHKPRIIFFDEATSALDNRTQEIVSKSLESLNATRLVIAHRLSTIINANRIYVIEAGKVVQVGTYSQLMEQRGVFADLARRQTM